MTKKKTETLEDVTTIISPSDNNDHIDGKVIRIVGYMAAGKTLMGVHLVSTLLDSGIYKPKDVISNVSLFDYGIKQRPNSDLKHWLSTLASLKRCRSIMFADEADQIWSHATTDRTQRELVLPIWQAVKNGDFIVLIQHEGLGIDLILRQAALITIDCQAYDKETDTVYFNLIDKMYGNFQEGLELNNASYYFKPTMKYDRWESHW